jgi:hypothetical protein
LAMSDLTAVGAGRDKRSEGVRAGARRQGEGSGAQRGQVPSRRPP